MKDKIELDKYETGILINSLNSFRNEQINLNKSSDILEPINNLLLKLMDFYEKKTSYVKYLRKDNYIR